MLRREFGATRVLLFGSLATGRFLPDSDIFELDVERIEHLVQRYPAVWRQVEADIQCFIAWLRALADQMPAE